MKGLLIKIYCKIFGHYKMFKKVNGKRFYKNGYECGRCNINL